MLMQNRDGFDIFLSNAVLYGVDGFKVLEGVSTAMDIPLIVMSIEDHAPATIRCVFHGFCDCLFGRNMKEVFKDLWWRVHRRRKCKSEDPAHTGDSGNGGNRPRQEAFENSDIASFESEEKLKEEKEATTRLLKKPRVAWDPQLHQRFVSAVDQLGGEKKAFPKRILEIMDIPELTRDNVASHLQKYRDQVRRENNAKESREKSLVPKSIPGNVHEHPMNEIRDIKTRSWTQQYPTMNGNDGFPSMNMDVQMAPLHHPTEPVIAGNEGQLNFSDRVAEISTLPSPPPPLNFPMNEIRDINTRSWTQQYLTMNSNEWLPSMNMDVQMARLHHPTEPVIAGNEGQLNFSDRVAEISTLPSPPPPLNFPMNEIRDINKRSWTQQYPTMNGNDGFPSMNMDVQMGPLHQPTEPVIAGNRGQLNFSDRVAEISTLPSPPPPLNFPVCPSSAIQLEKSSFDCNIWEMVNQDGDLASMPEGFLSWEYRSSTPA